MFVISSFCLVMKQKQTEVEKILIVSDLGILELCGSESQGLTSSCYLKVCQSMHAASTSQTSYNKEGRSENSLRSSNILEKDHTLFSVLFP